MRHAGSSVSVGIALLASTLTVPLVRAQSLAPSAVFEAATIKADKSGDDRLLTSWRFA
jgi:hypothetical protein